MQLPSCLRSTIILAGGVFVFFLFSGLAVVLLIASVWNPALLGASGLSLLLAFALPMAMWLIAQPGLQRQRAEEAERWAAVSAQYEAERVQRAAYNERVRQERLRTRREESEAWTAAYGDDLPRANSLADGHAAPVYYEILAVDTSASTDDVERAYRREMREHHPDRGGESRRAQLINEAYETLRDPARRRTYDRENGLR